MWKWVQRGLSGAGLVVVSVGLVAVPATGDGAGLQSAERLNPPARRASFAFTGDILTHRPVNNAALQPNGSHDYAPMFAPIAPLLSWADVAVCHLEQPVAPPGTPVNGDAVRHSSAASIATALRSSGYDRCSTASNHNLDRGIAGIDATVTALTAAGVGQSGMARSPGEAIPQVFDVNGIAVAHLSYAYHLGGELPAGESWRANLIDPATIIAAARDARARGAEVVIASLHWGSAAQSTPSAYQRQVGHAVTASGEIDLVVGHHAHVLQPIEQVNGTWVVWGLGNLISNMPFSFWPASTQDGAIVTVVVSREEDGRVTVERPLVYPTWYDKARGYVVHPTSARHDASLPLSVRISLGASEARTRAVLGPFFGPG